MAALLGGLLFLEACGRDSSELPKITFSSVEPASQQPAPGDSIRIAIASTVSLQRTIRDYERMLRYVGRKLGVPVELVQRAGYAECLTLLERREVQAAFMCSGPYVEGRERFGAEPLVVPVVGGRSSYRGLVIVRKDSPFRSFADLRGRSFAFTDPLSATGRLFPAYLLAGIGETPESYFGQIVMARTHDNAIEAVAVGLADGAAVSSLVWDALVRSKDGHVARTRVIQRSPALGMPPLVVHPGLDPALKRRLRAVFLTMHRDVEGRELLAHAGIGRFIEGQDSTYDGLRRLRAAARPR